MLSVPRITVAISILLLIAGCQSIEMRSDAWKQKQIMTIYRKYAKKFPQVEGITPAELQQLQRQRQQVVLVDVRSPEEREVSFIPGAISIVEFERNSKQYQNSTIVAYCTIGYRSGKYAEKFRQQGIKILNLEGSLLAWSHAQGKLINSQGLTNKVHVFAPQWRFAAEDYESVW